MVDWLFCVFVKGLCKVVFSKLMTYIVGKSKIDLRTKCTSVLISSSHVTCDLNCYHSIEKNQEDNGERLNTRNLFGLLLTSLFSCPVFRPLASFCFCQASLTTVPENENKLSTRALDNPPAQETFMKLHTLHHLWRNIICKHTDEVLILLKFCALNLHHIKVKTRKKLNFSVNVLIILHQSWHLLILRN